MPDDNELEDTKKSLAEDIKNLDWDDKEKHLKIRAFEEIHGFDVLQQLKEFKGPFNKQGGYINYHEWHAFFIGAGLIDMAFRLQEGAFIYFYLFLGFKVLKDCHECRDRQIGPEYEIWKNFHYFILAGFLAAVIWTEMSNAGVPRITFGLVESINAITG